MLKSDPQKHKISRLGKQGCKPVKEAWAEKQKADLDMYSNNKIPKCNPFEKNHKTSYSEVILLYKFQVLTQQ